jgi:hypothetical protein
MLCLVSSDALLQVNAGWEPNPRRAYDEILQKSPKIVSLGEPNPFQSAG